MHLPQSRALDVLSPQFPEFPASAGYLGEKARNENR